VAAERGDASFAPPRQIDEPATGAPGSCSATAPSMQSDDARTAIAKVSARPATLRRLPPRAGRQASP